MITKKEFARYILTNEAINRVKDYMQPTDIRWDNAVALEFCKICINADKEAISSTTIGIACETLGIIHNIDTLQYLYSRGGVALAFQDKFSGNILDLSIREIMDMLPDEIERHNAVYNPDERIGMTITFLQDEDTSVKIVEDDDPSSMDFTIAYNPKDDGVR